MNIVHFVMLWEEWWRIYWCITTPCSHEMDPTDSRRSLSNILVPTWMKYWQFNNSFTFFDILFFATPLLLFAKCTSFFIVDFPFRSSRGFWIQKKEIPPGKLTWNLKIICLKREIIFQTIINHPFSGSMLIFRGVFMRWLGVLAELPFSSELDADIGKDPGADAQKKTKSCESVILM